MNFTVAFSTHEKKQATVSVPTGTLLSDAANLAGIEIAQPCGGQGRCGRCAVQVTAGKAGAMWASLCARTNAAMRGVCSPMRPSVSPTTLLTAVRFMLESRLQPARRR